jgi:hypothetical protein
MSPCLFLAAVLLPGQTVAGEPAPVLPLPVLEAPSPASSPDRSSTKECGAPQAAAKPEQDCGSSGTGGSERWMLMKLLQNTVLGKALDSQRTEITGWTALGFLTSTSPAEPGSNWAPRLNKVLLRQEWIRIDRTIDANNSSEPTFGFEDHYKEAVRYICQTIRRAKDFAK